MSDVASAALAELNSIRASLSTQLQVSGIIMTSVPFDDVHILVDKAIASLGETVDYLEFTSSVINSIAWPSALVIGIWIFRREIRPLIPRLHFKHKETEVSFRLSEAEKAVEQLPPAPPEALSPPADEISKFEQIARISPRSALLEIRREVEDVLQREASRLQQRPWGQSGRAMPARQALRILREKSAINVGAANLLEDALAIGNIAAHDQSAVFSFSDAMRYRSLVDHALSFLSAPPVNGPEDFPGIRGEV